MHFTSLDELFKECTLSIDTDVLFKMNAPNSFETSIIYDS